MINAALVENNQVTNVIYITETNLYHFKNAGMELIDTATIDLAIGDYREEDSWFRDVEGTKTLIEPEPTEAEDMQAALEALGVEPVLDETEVTV